MNRRIETRISCKSNFSLLQIDFLDAIYQENLEETSFLYEHRLGLLYGPERIWLDIEDFEDRFEPHIDGMAVVEDLTVYST